jgi:hypothetical protein
LIYQKGGYHRGVNPSPMVKGFLYQDCKGVKQRPIPRGLCHPMRETNRMDRVQVQLGILGGHSHSHLS